MKNKTIFKHKSLIYLVAVLMAIFLNACKKQSSSKNDTTKPIITIAEPMVNDTISLSNEPELHIEFTVTDNTGLHSLSVLLIKNSTDTLMYEKPAVSDLEVYSFHQHVVPAGISGLVNMRVLIEADDHHGNAETRTIDFFVVP